MHRPAWLRTLIAIWGLWFTTSVVEPAGLFACEMHGAVASQHLAAHAVSASAPLHHAQSPAHAHHDATPVTDVGVTTVIPSPDPSTPGHHSCCTCLGQCCQSIPVVAPSTAIALASLVERDAAVAAITVASRGHSRRPYALPFANGPPPTAL